MLNTYLLNTEFFIHLGYALGIGILIGLERSFGPLGIGKKSEYKKKKLFGKENRTHFESIEFMGVRTFSILSLAGFSFGMAGEKYPFLPPLAVLSIVILIVAMYLYDRRHGAGITTEVSAIVTFALGLLTHSNPQAAGIIALLITIILSAKHITYDTVAKMRRVELTDTLKFLVIILIILPLLPDTALDPYNVLNPYKVGFLIILISGISFVGYFLTRILGAQKGLGITGFLGGLTSSTAVTAAMSSEAKKNSSLISVCAFSTLIANATMFLRVLVVVIILDLELFLNLVLSMGFMALTAILISVYLWFSASQQSRVQEEAAGQVKLKNPFSIGPAVTFGIFFIIILFAVRFGQDHFGDSGLFAASVLSGLADVDAITLSISEQASKGLLSRESGALGITIAVVSNSAVKTGIAFYSGGIRFGKVIAFGLGSATAAGLAAAFLLNY